MRLIAALALALAAAPPGRPAEIGVFANPLGDPAHALYLGDYARLDNWAIVRSDCFHHRDSLTTPEAAVLVSGRIEEGDAERFVAAVEPYATTYGPEVFECPRLVVLLDSGGGSLLEAIRLGRAIAERGLATVVPTGATCLSACSFVFAGGSFPLGTIPNMVLFAGGRIGLHQPQFELSERQRERLAAAPNAPDMAYALAGAQWTEIYDYMVNARRNPYLLQLMLASPPEGDRFNDLASFEELYLAGARLVAPGLTPGAPTGLAALTAGSARHVCALAMIRAGAQEGFAAAEATPLGSLAIFGAPVSQQFCLVTYGEGFFGDAPEDTETLDACLFPRDVFADFDAAELPRYIEQFGYGAMGNFPIEMFDRSLLAQFPVEGESEAETGAALEAFFALHAFDICTHRESFYVADLMALPDSMWIDADCPQATRMCETGRPLSENLAAAR